jgi:endonuclease/exonuclease/phosphatase family metal-dependent hydrolase
MQRLLKFIFGLLALATVLAIPTLLAQSAAGKGTVKVMTYNLNEGSDFVEVLSAQTFPEFVQAVQTTLNQVDTSNPPLRMQAIAHQIAIAQPDLVGMQEVSTWLVGDPSTPAVRYDMLRELMSALKAQGQNYKVVVVVPEFLLAGPLSGDLSNWLFVQDTDVMLARSDKGDMQISNVQFGNYNTLLSLPTVAGPVTITRGWGSADVALQHQQFRFIVTHVENYIAQAPGTLFIQEAQAKELADGPAYEMKMPVIIAGDFNADALGNDPSIATHQEMLSFGFSDAWGARYPNDPAPTWPLLDSSPTSSTAFQRIDYIWALGDVRPLNLSLVGTVPHDKVSGLWPSDHAGVRATLQLGRPWE